jgi:enamine deaminase RidA (YjgF/YER057c/UK114 family)
LPQNGNTLREQTQSAVDALIETLRGFDANDSLLHLTFFLADAGKVAACREIVRKILGDKIPATSYVPQPPCEGSLVGIEALAIGKGKEKVEITRISDQLLLARQNGSTWVYADQAVPSTSAPGVYEKTVCCYQHLRRLLPLAGARIDQTLRTWLYLGGIVDDDGPTQRYKELNRARTDVYESVPFLTERLPDDHDGPAYPASTGIGTNGRNISISAVALLSEEEEVVAVPLENPRQTAAFAYSTRYSPQTPKFSRGMAIVHGANTTIYVSGTASITHSETRHVGDVVAQTHETLENIGALISEENLSHHGLPGCGTSLQGIAVARVYVKRPEDYLAVRDVCESRLPGVPLTYLVADVCRPDLLVEIEAIALSENVPPAGSSGHEHARRHTKRDVNLDLVNCGHVCPSGCPERGVCPHAVLS